MEVQHTLATTTKNGESRVWQIPAVLAPSTWPHA